MRFGKASLSDQPLPLQEGGINTLPEALKVTQEEFLQLWALRYMRADGKPWPGMHFGSFCNALAILRGPTPSRLAPYRPGR